MNSLLIVLWEPPEPQKSPTEAGLENLSQQTGN